MAGSKANFQVGLQFSADTKQAKAQLTDLSKSLENLVKNNMTNLPLTDKIREASQAASYLKASLDGAINANTGKLDISKFSESLKQGGYNVEQLKMHLESLGPEGIKAFQKVAVAVATAEAPAKRLSGLMTNLLRSFAQTAKYQFTASIYRGLIGGIQSAYHYAQDLNESLNNIRIVTGQSAEQMAKFAEQANKAAKQLSVTTTEYTNGALIYYQQGLSDEEVKARTDVTMKLANASGVSAETASEQLTAIWNNFAKGSENLEYFADVITALGASTASSTSEISEGLEKFAAIGESVGLSYEYAASALATVTATTRQSADVVGTAFKTLFARIQDLELGDTLEDGTTLGKYSQALAAVGVNIKESNGELKAMDQILNEMAGAWSTISKDQQVALAQTVAGTRQYTQLIALMENWGFMQQNLNTAYNSTGTLQEQADIYAESWEAAQKRAKAALEDIYSSLINDDFFIDLLNFFEKFLGQIKVAINSLGGLQGVLFTISNLVMTFAGDSVAKGINNSIYNIRSALGLVKKDTEDFASRITGLVGELSTSAYGERAGSLIKDLTSLQSELLAKYPEMTQEQREMNNVLFKSLQTASDILIKKEEELKVTKEISEVENKKNQKQVEKILTSGFNTENINNRDNKQLNTAIGTYNYNANKGNDITPNNLITEFEKVRSTLTKREQELLNQLKEANQGLEKEKANNLANELVKEYSGVQKKINSYNNFVGTQVSKYVNNPEAYLNTNNNFMAKATSYMNDSNVDPKVIEALKKWQEEISKAGNNVSQVKQAFIELQKEVQGTKLYDNNALDYYESVKQKVIQISENIGKLKSLQTFGDGFEITNENSLAGVRQYRQELQNLINSLDDTSLAKGSKTALQEGLDKLSQELEKETPNIQAVSEAFKDLNKIVVSTEIEVAGEYSNKFIESVVAMGGSKTEAEFLSKALETLSESTKDQSDQTATLTRLHELYTQAVKQSREELERQQKPQADFGKGVQGAARALSGFGQTLNTVKGFIQQAKEGTLNLTSILTTLPSMIFGITSAWNGLKTAFAASPILGTITVAIAVIGSIITVINKIKNAAKESSELATKKAEELAKAYDEAKESAEKFKDTISNYNDAVKGLEDLTQGTEEYKEKLEEANKAAQDLIDNYGDDLAGKWHFDVATGRIKIDDHALEELQKTLGERTTKAGEDSLTAKIDANNKANQALLKEISGNKETQKTLEDLAEIYSHNGQDLEGAFNRLDSTQQALLNETNVDQNKIQEYLKQVNGKQLDNIQYQKKINGNLVKFNEDYLNGANDEVKRDFVYDYTVANGASASERQAAANVDFLSDENGLYFQLRERSNAEDPYWLNKYLQESGRLDVEKFDAIAEDIKKSFELVDLSKLSTVQQNEFQRLYRVLTNNQLSLNDRVNALKGLIDFDKTNNLLADLKTSVEIIEEDNKNQATAEELFDKTAELFGEDETNALNFLNGIKNGQSGGLSYLRQNMTYSGLNAFSPEDFAKTFGKGLGWITHDEGTEEYEKDLKNFTEKLKKYQEEGFNDLQKTANKSFGEIFNYDDLSLDAFKNISNEQFSKIINSSNNIAKQYGPEVARIIKEAMLNEEDPFGLLMAIDNIDWSDTSLTDAFKKLKEAGYKLSEDTFLNFAKTLQDSATNAKYFTSSLKDLLSAFKEVQDIISKVSFGQVISSEDYEKLIKERKDLEGKFVYTINGWLYIGDTNDLNNSNFNAIDIDKNFETAQREIETVKSNVNLKNLDNEQIAYNYGGDNFSTLAGARSGVDIKALEEALDTLESETASKDAKDFAQKIVDAYATAIRELPSLEKQFDESNRATTYVQQTVKSLDELEDKWDELSERYKTLDKETATRIVAANELVSRGIDVSAWEDYYKTLIKLHPELKNNTELAMRMATANMVASNGLKTLSSNYANWIKTLETAKDTNTLDSADAVEALNGFQSALADIMSLEQEDLNQISADFLIKHAELIEEAMSGEENAMYQLIAYAMETQGVIQENQVQDYIKLQEWIAEHPLATALEINAYLKSTDSSLASLIGTKDLNKLLEAGGAEIYGGKWYARDLNVKSLTPDDKGKSSSKKNLKSLDDEIDRYHYIRKLLADIERELERVDKAKERAYGSQHLKYIEQETDYLREQVGLQDRYISEIEGYLAKDRGLIAAYGAQFDATGNISNYNELFASNFNKYANAEDSTNWENFKKALSTYEETLDLWFEQTEEKAELLRQILDKQLEGIQYKVEVNIEVNDRELELLEYQLNRLDDTAYDTADALVNIGSQFEVVEEKIKTTTNGIIDTLKTIPGITQAQIDAYLAGDGEALAGLHIEDGQIEMLQDYSSQLLELSDTIKKLHDNALQKVSEAFDAWGEKIEDHIAKFQHLNTLINNYQEIIGLLGRSNIGISNEFMREMRNQEIVNLQGILNTRTQVKDNLAAQLADARKRASEATTEAEREDWEQVADDIEQRLKDATESWQQAWIDALQANKEAFEATMQDIVDSFDDYEDELKRYDTAQDRYLEPYRQAYELSKLTRDIDNSINDQDSIRAKKELQKLEDKIAQIKESGRAISENELGLLQKEYELRLAEIALEDAQNAKSLVRLTRNNEGNWGYTYVADQDKIDEAQQNYEDKLYEYMRAADTMAEEASRTILTLNKEMAEALAALDANAVDYEAKVAEITQFYTDQINYFAEQYGISTDAINTVAKESAAKYKPEVVDIIESDNSGLQTNFDETVLAIIGDFEDLEDAINGPDGALPNIQRAYSETLTAFEDYREQNKLTCERAGADVSQMRELMETEFGKIKTQTKETDGATKEMAENMKSYLDAVLNNFGDFAERYSSKVNVVSNANIALANSIIGLERALNNIDASSLETLKKAADQVEAIAQTVKLAADAADGASSGGKSNNVNQLDGYFYVGRTADGTQYWGKAGDQYGKNDIYSLKDNKLAYSWSTYGRVNSFATGGYTGEWGDSGRLALLHEKELVLNKEDTSNILNAVSLIRQLTLGTAQLSNGLGAIGAGLSNFNINPASMDQNVNISASFPNVRDRYEIEEAFNNLVNKASQYAFRENRYTPNYV